MAAGVQFSYENVPPLPGEEAQALNRQAPSAANGIAQFELVAVRKADGTYENVEYVNILVPGDFRASPMRKVTDGLRRKYAAYYDMWKRGLEASPVGTPLEAWPAMTPAHVRALKAANIFTVEQLADVADSALYNIPLGQSLRTRARDWLKVKRESDAIEQMTRREEQLAAQNALLQEQLGNLASRLEAMESAKAQAAAPSEFDMPEVPAKRGPGRPPKE